MICRICLGEEHSETMVTPCRCAGTSAYVHPDCLVSYFQYYPDRVCRVCLTEMEGPVNPFLSYMMIVLLGMSITYSSSPFLTKLGLSAVLLALSVYYSKKNLFNETVVSFLLVLYLTFATGGHPDAVFLFLFVLYVTSVLFSIFLTRQLLLLLLVAPAVFSMTVYILLSLDAVATAVYLSLLFLIWYAWIRTAVRV